MAEGGMIKTYCHRLLQQYLVVLAERGTEYDTRHALETMNPLLPLRTLTPNVKHVYSTDVALFADP
jgi:hypothetical protein